MSEIALTAKEIHILKHALTGSGKGEVYRNYFYAQAGNGDLIHINRLIELGLMTKGDYAENENYYYCTEAGAAFVGLHLPKR